VQGEPRFLTVTSPLGERIRAVPTHRAWTDIEGMGWRFHEPYGRRGSVGGFGCLSLSLGSEAAGVGGRGNALRGT
jgi:hypothetical protein